MPADDTLLPAKKITKMNNIEMPTENSKLTMATVKHLVFMHLRAILCTFQISVDFYYVPVGGRGGAGRGGGDRERVIECIMYGYS
jgi:hypothetical protein